jgi:hypothetical protein
MSEKIILVKGKAGLGNRLLAVLSALLYADMTKRRVIIDWRDRAYAKPGENAFEKLFASPATGDPSAYESVTSVAPVSWRGRLHHTVDEVLGQDFPKDVEVDNNRRKMAAYTSSLRKLDYDEDVLVRWAWTHELADLRPRFGWSGRRYAIQSDNQILRGVVKEHLRPSTELARRVNEFAKANFVDEMIGLHVRYSDRKNPFKHFRVYVDRFLERHPQGRVFLATDNSEVEEYFKGIFPNKVSSAPKWMPPPGQPIHRTRSADRDPSEGALEALTDMYLLGRCQRLVVNTTSTFGHCAVLLSDAGWRDVINTAPRLRTEARRAISWVQARLGR